MKKIILVSLIFLVNFISYFFSVVIADDNKLLENLIFPDAYEIVSGYDEQLGLLAISYKVKLKFPSKKILEFCDKKLEELGWQRKIEYTPEVGDRGWIDFIDGTKEREPLVHQLFASWTNQDRSKMITLLLRYYSYNLTDKEKLCAQEPNTDVLNVIVQIGPYVDLENVRLNKAKTNLR